MVLAQEYNQGGRSKKRLQEKLLLSCGLKNEQKLSEDQSIENFKRKWGQHEQRSSLMEQAWEVEGTKKTPVLIELRKQGEGDTRSAQKDKWRRGPTEPLQFKM